MQENLTENNKLDDVTSESADALNLGDFLPYRLATLAKEISTAFAITYEARFGITIPQWRVMSALGNFPDCSASHVAEYSNLDKVQVSRAVTGLVEMGFVFRSLDSRDRRNSVLRLSDKGQSVYQQIIPVARDFEARFTATLTSDESAQLDILLAKLMKQAKNTKNHD